MPGARALPPPDGPALLLHPEDLGPEIVADGVSVAGALAATGGSAHWPWGAAAGRFIDAAAEDAAAHARERFSCMGSVMEAIDPDAVLAAARAAGAVWVLAPEVPVGPVADALANLAGPLAAAGMPLVQVRRSWDEALWPLATKSFFSFRQRCPAVLAAEGLRL